MKSSKLQNGLSIINRVFRRTAVTVIRDTVPLSHERRSSLLDDLQTAVAGSGPLGNPVIFEIPLPGSRFDVLVVWEAWQGVEPEERTDIITAAYGDRSPKIVQAMGVTYEEAIRERLLPYAVQPCAREGRLTSTRLREVMLEEGAIAFGKQNADLRFPTMRMAKAAFEHLRQRFPQGHWSLTSETPGFLTANTHSKVE